MNVYYNIHIGKIKIVHEWMKYIYNTLNGWIYTYFDIWLDEKCIKNESKKNFFLAHILYSINTIHMAWKIKS